MLKSLLLVFLFGAGVYGARQLKPESKIVFNPAELSSSKPPSSVPSLTSQELVIDVSGAVKNPGVRHLKEGQRVQDAIEACGGLTDQGDSSSLNLAAKLIDGSKLVVPRLNEAVQVDAAYDGHQGAQTYSSSASKSNSSLAKNSINLNTATLSDLDRLPGVGQVTAQSILDYRKQRGGFTSIDNLLEVKGIGPNKLEKIRPFVRL